MKKRLVLAILISGSGSNLQAIIDAIEAGTLDARIACVIREDDKTASITDADIFVERVLDEFVLGRFVGAELLVEPEIGRNESRRFLE